MIKVTQDVDNDKVINRLNELERRIIPPIPKATTDVQSPITNKEGSEEGIACRLVTLLDQINKFSGDYRFTDVKSIESNSTNGFVLPTLAPNLAEYNLRALLKLIRLPATKITDQTIHAFRKELREAGARFLPQGTNNIQFIKAAAEKKIPFKILPDQIIIFGYGAGSQYFKSSITERDSVIGVQLARNKHNTNRLLRHSGLPVTPQILIKNPDQIETFTKTYGFPIALKPTTEEQGRGIHTNILDLEEAREIFSLLKQKYSNILLEKHIHGDGYRVHLLDDQCVRVVKQEAAHVIGDGKLTIMELIVHENQLSKRCGPHALMKPIKLDDTTTRTLKKQNLTLDDIPENGQKIILSPTSNSSRGGSFTDYLSQIHPDNIEICIQASKTLGLYCAGIDLISTDASISWRKNNTVICEVNAQPQIGFGQKLAIHDEMVWSAVQKFPEIHICVRNDKKRNYSDMFNRTKSTIHITISAEEILKSGCPTQYFTTIQLDSDIPQNIRAEIQIMLESILPKNISHA